MVIHEYYAGSETNGLTAITPEQWLDHPGSVGKPVLGNLHICDDDGEPVPQGTTGLIYFSGLPPFAYKGDEKKTGEAYNAQGWSTLGDIGYVDDEGFLYLKDRKSFMIISGGVNVYPAEVENTLITHDKIFDAAVLGVPHDDLGEEVVGVVQLTDNSEANKQLGEEIIDFCKVRIAGFKCPRRIIFMESLPRLPNGKLLKRNIKEMIS